MKTTNTSEFTETMLLATWNDEQWKDCPRLKPVHPKLVGSVQHIGTNTYNTRTQQQKKLLYFEWSPPWHFKTARLDFMSAWLGQVRVDIQLISWNAFCYSQLGRLTGSNLLTFFLTYLLPFFLPYLQDLLTYLLTFFLIYLLTYLADISSDISSDILSDISSDILSDISSDIFLTYLLTFFLTYLLTFFLTYLLTFFLTYLLTFFLTYLLTFFLTYLLTDLLTFFLTYLLTFFLTYLLTFFLTVRGWGPARHTELTGSQLRSGTPHWPHMIAVEVRHATLNSHNRGWGPARHTELTQSRLRSGTPHWTHAIAVEVRHATLNSHDRSWGPARHTEHTWSQEKDEDAERRRRRGEAWRRSDWQPSPDRWGTNTSYAQQPSHRTLFMPDTFYTSWLLHQTPFTPENF